MMKRYVARVLPVLLLAVLCVGQSAAAQTEEAITFDPQQTKVEFTLGDVLHTVHGTFKLKSGVIRFDPATGAASGALVVDATSGDSGNKSRDKKMNRDILQSDKYPEIVFTPQHVTGTVPATGQSSVKVDGLFRLHGEDHPLTITVPFSVNAAHVSATTSFTVPYQAWGLKNPSTLFLRVSDKVDISIAATGQVTTEQAAAKR